MGVLKFVQKVDDMELPTRVSLPKSCLNFKLP